MSVTQKNSKSGDFRNNFAVLTNAQKNALNKYGILSFDGNDGSDDKDLEAGMKAAFDIAEEASSYCYEKQWM